MNRIMVRFSKDELKLIKSNKINKGKMLKDIINGNFKNEYSTYISNSVRGVVSTFKLNDIDIKLLENISIKNNKSKSTTIRNILLYHTLSKTFID